MIYLDCAATSFQKPKAVRAAVFTAITTMTSPGRGGHPPAMLAAETALECRREIAELFNVRELENVAFTMNATHALNIAIQSLVKNGDRVVISGYEHNAVTRPLHAIGADVLVTGSPLFDREAAIKAFYVGLKDADCAICTHVSNAFGFILPIEKISEMCNDFGVPFIIDASQSAGAMDIDFTALNADYIAMPGHKGLLGPQGTGVLLCKDSASPVLYGGTGSDSICQDMPQYLPDRLEAGTHNIPGIAGLLEGVKYVKKRGISSIARHERRLMLMAAAGLRNIEAVEVFCSDDFSAQSGVLSVRVKGMDCGTAAELLSDAGAFVRAGLHCAPTAHKTAGTLDTGTVRLSFSPFNTEAEVGRLIAMISKIVKKV